MFQQSHKIVLFKNVIYFYYLYLKTNQLEGTTQKHIYQIHIKECAKSVLSSIASDNSISDEIYQRYKATLSVAIIEYYKTTVLVKESTEVDLFNMSIVDVNHPSFDYWFALFISTRKVYEVPLILDTYSNNDFGVIDNFRGRLQFFILKILDKQIPYNIDGIVKALLSWIREENVSSSLVDETFEDKERKIKIDLIKTGLKYEELFDYFAALHHNLEKKEGKLTLRQVERLIRSNFYFKNSNRKQPGIKRFNVKIQKQFLINFVHQFYLYKDMNIYRNKLDDYAKFLINNFDLFQNNNASTLKTNFNKCPKKLNPLTKK